MKLKNYQNFKLYLAPRHNIKSFDTENGRYYEAPNNTLLPSVTTVLSKSPYIDNKYLERWKNRVGEKTANEISTQSKIRGTNLHRIFENFILNKDYKTNEMPINLYSFNPIAQELQRNVSAVIGIELPVYSYNYNTAGRIDAILFWKKKPVIFDLKTSKKIKKEQDILSYFIQATCYTLLFNELYNTNISDIVICIATDHEKPLIFERKIKEYLSLTQTIFKGQTNV